MLTGTYYLNNSGSRWVEYVNGKRAVETFLTDSGKEVKRVPIYYEAFGNFAGMTINYLGQKMRVFADTVLPDSLITEAGAIEKLKSMGYKDIISKNGFIYSSKDFTVSNEGVPWSSSLAYRWEISNGRLVEIDRHYYA